MVKKPRNAQQGTRRLARVAPAEAEVVLAGVDEPPQRDAGLGFHRERLQGRLPVLPSRGDDPAAAAQGGAEHVCKKVHRAALNARTGAQSNLSPLFQLYITARSAS